MRSLILLALLAGSAIAQTPVFPGGVATDSALGVARNNISDQLTSGLSATGTSMTVLSGAGIVPNMLLSLNKNAPAPEIVWVCQVVGTTVGTTITIGKGTCPSVNGRGIDGTVATAHVEGESVMNVPVSWYSNALRVEVEALEAQAIGGGGTGGSGPFLSALNYNFTAQTPGGSITASIINTVTLTPVPAGVNGADAGHMLYLSGGTGTAEAVLISGGTAVSGTATGTIFFTPAHAHSGAWTVTSAAAGIPEALQVLVTAGGGTVVAGGGTALTVNGNVSVAGTGLALHFLGSGATLANGASILMAGTNNSVAGEGGTILTATSTGGDLIQLNSCVNCTISGLFLIRGTSGRPAVSGAGIDVASGGNTSLRVSNITSEYNYRGIWAQVSPVLSSWDAIQVLNNVTQGIEFDADNDEHFTNVWALYNGGHALQVGNGTSTTYCIGGFRIANFVTYANGGDGVHIVGASGFPCTYVFLDNVHADTDTGYELYVQNSSAITAVNSQFINGKGGYVGTGASFVSLGTARFNGSSGIGLHITSTATNIQGNGVLVGDASYGFAATYPELQIDGTVSNVNIAGLTLNSADATSSAGVLISGTPSAIHLSSVQMLAGSNMNTPVSMVSGLTDVFVDAQNWLTMTLAAGWTTVSTPQCRLEMNGLGVRCEGTITAGTTADGTVIFTLPVGYRPNLARAIPVVCLTGGAVPSDTNSCTLAVGINGAVTIYGVGANSYIRMDALAFANN
jgi:hypothetical protein